MDRRVDRPLRPRGPLIHPDVVVVGAGFAGVAAATSLAERGARVLVLETRQRPGGRAYSWTDPRSGEIRDNGQHVLGSFYEETLRLLRRIGTQDELAADPAFHLRFWERGRGSFELRCPRIPAPFHWIAAVASCARLSPAARLGAASLRRRLRALFDDPGAGALTVEQWLDTVPGREDLAVLLRPLALAALNERPEDGSAVLFARAIETILDAPAARSGLALARRGLGDLLGGFERFVETRGGSVRYRATALGVRIEQGRATGVSLLGGERVDAGAVLLAVPHERITWMLRPEWAEPYRAVASIPWSPIVSTLHVYDRPVLPARFVGLIGTRTQWAFDRGRRPDGHHVGTVRSAAFEDAEREPESLAAETAAELSEAFPEARSAALLRTRVYKERRATIRCTPETQPLRPGAKTAVEGLVLAGDWTDTSLPATIEGAVSSGHRAAELIR